MIQLCWYYFLLQVGRIFLRFHHFFKRSLRLRQLAVESNLLWSCRDSHQTFQVCRISPYKKHGFTQSPLLCIFQAHYFPSLLHQSMFGRTRSQTGYLFPSAFPHCLAGVVWSLQKACLEIFSHTFSTKISFTFRRETANDSHRHSTGHSWLVDSLCSSTDSDIP